MSSNVQLDSLLALRQVVRALELRFPDHNGPFEYGTRLAEETGELIEAISDMRANVVSDAQKHHLVKEVQDVLRVAYGIANLYNLAQRLPVSLDKFDPADNPRDLVAYIVQIGVASGELATAINHAEGVGVKKEKHGDTSSQHVYEKSYALARVIAWMVAYFDIGAELETQIAEAYLDYKEKGFIK